MNIRRFKPSVTVVAVAIAVLIGAEMPAVAHQVSAAAHKISGSTIKKNSVTGKQIDESTLGTVPSATLATSLPPLQWHKLTLINGWIAGNSARPPAVAVDAQGIVHFRGSIGAGTDGMAFTTLPAFVRPRYQESLPTRIGSYPFPGFIIVNADGTTFANNPSIDPAGSNVQNTSLEGISYTR